MYGRTCRLRAEAAKTRILLRGTRLDLRDVPLAPADRALLEKQCGELEARLARVEQPEPEFARAR